MQIEEQIESISHPHPLDLCEEFIRLMDRNDEHCRFLCILIYWNLVEAGLDTIAHSENPLDECREQFVEFLVCYFWARRINEALFTKEILSLNKLTRRLEALVEYLTEKLGCR